MHKEVERVALEKIIVDLQPQLPLQDGIHSK